MSFLSIPSTSVNAPGYPPEDPAIAYTFPLDPFQQQAVMSIHRGENVLVTAKTGSGKTLVGEYQIAYSLRQKKRVFYTTPIKSLSNQKYHDLKHLFPGNSVGIMTGDIKSNPEADIVVMTTEILRNLLFKQSTATSHLGTAGQISLENVGAVVFDEVHYINDPDRGHVWEETLILLPSDIRLVLLSATIDSPELFAGWLGNAKQRPIALLKTTYRIVPLVHGVYDPTTPLSQLPLQPLKKGDEAPYQAGVYKEWLKGKDARLKAAEDWAARVKAAQQIGESIAGAEGKVKLHSFTHSLNECVEQLKERDLLPALFFLFSRKDCERYAEQIQGSLIDSSAQADVKHILKFHLHKYSETLEHLPQYHQIVGLLGRGIGFHHSGLLPLLKEIVELLFSRGFIKVLFCTETFAVGLNMPARTVVFLDLKKPGGSDTGFRPLRSDEYIQMAGRAGRRGKDTQGVVLYLPARKPVEPDEIRKTLTGALVPLESRLQFHYDFILKALHASASASDDATANKKPLWDAVIDNSYWQAQRTKAKSAALIELAALRDDMAALPISEAEHTELAQKKLLETQVKDTGNAAKKKAQADLDRWRDRHLGPKWTALIKLYENYERLDKKAQRVEAQIADLESPASANRVAPILRALVDWSALSPEEDSADSEDSPTLTEFGVYATEINEANPLLIAKLYESGLLRNASAEEIVGTLGAFIVDRESQEKSEHPRALPPNISDRVKDTLLTIQGWSETGQALDKKHGIESPEMYWDTTTLWTRIGTEWFLGGTAGEIASTYDIYEGNLMRGLLKLANLVNEWTSLATYKADVDMLERLKTVQIGLIRDIAQPESLYLRM
jgi:superfamily II RNA helicase